MKQEQEVNNRRVRLRLKPQSDIEESFVRFISEILLVSRVPLPKAMRMTVTISTNSQSMSRKWRTKMRRMSWAKRNSYRVSQESPSRREQEIVKPSNRWTWTSWLGDRGWLTCRSRTTTRSCNRWALGSTTKRVSSMTHTMIMCYMHWGTRNRNHWVIYLKGNRNWVRILSLLRKEDLPRML